MSMGSAAAMAMRGGFDMFDKVSNYLDDLIARLRAVDSENMLEVIRPDAALVDGFFGTEEQHADPVSIRDVRAELIEQLQEHKQALDAILLYCQQVEAFLPD